jgi:hypothetical protein
MHWSFPSTAAIVIVASLALSSPSLAQDFGVRSMKPSFPEEKRPKVDEKAYKAALEKIPTPTKKYDPWGSARSGELAQPDKKSN